MDKRVLMCPPEHYEVAYEINPWMSIRRPIDKGKAGKQWADYHGFLTSKLGVRVELMEPVKGLPDLVFTANAGFVSQRTFVRSNFRHRERQGEEPRFEAWFRKKKFKIAKVDSPLCFEGEGDMLAMGEELFTGYRFRSDLQAHDQAAGLLGKTYFALELTDRRFYHLDTCFAPLNSRVAMVYMPAFDPCAQFILWENVPDLIAVSEEEALKFACNSFVADNQVVMPEGCPAAAHELEGRGFKVHSLDFSEFIKAGGAAKCLALNL